MLELNWEIRAFVLQQGCFPGHQNRLVDIPGHQGEIDAHPASAGDLNLLPGHAPEALGFRRHGIRPGRERRPRVAAVLAGPELEALPSEVVGNRDCCARKGCS